MANPAQLAAARRPKKGVFGDSYIQEPELLRNNGRYDTWRIASGATLRNEYDFFQTPQGQSGSGFAARRKTYAETNMAVGGRLPAAEQGTVDRIYVTITPEGGAAVTSAAADYLAAFYYDTLLEMRVDDNEVIGSRHIAEFQGYGINGYTSQAAAADIALLNGVATSTVSPLLLNTRIQIPSNTRFAVTLKPNSSNTFVQTVPADVNLRITVYLMGTFTTVAVN